MGQKPSSVRAAEAPPAVADLVPDPALVASLVGPVLRFDPLLVEMRMLLEQYLVRDIVNLIADYSHYGPLHWNYVRLVQYAQLYQPEQLEMLLNGHLNSVNITFCLFFLRLTASHRHLKYVDYQICEKLAQQPGKWVHQISTSSLFPVIKFGFEIYTQLLPYRPLEDLEAFFLSLWSPTTKQLNRCFEGHLQQASRSHWYPRVDLRRLAQSVDSAFGGIISMVGSPTKAEFILSVTTGFLAETPCCPYSTEEFAGYLNQLLDYKQEDAPPITTINMTGIMELRR